MAKSAAPKVAKAAAKPKAAKKVSWQLCIGITRGSCSGLWLRVTESTLVTRKWVSCMGPLRGPLLAAGIFLWSRTNAIDELRQQLSSPVGDFVFCCKWRRATGAGAQPSCRVQRRPRQLTGAPHLDRGY